MSLRAIKPIPLIGITPKPRRLCVWWLVIDWKAKCEALEEENAYLKSIIMDADSAAAGAVSGFTRSELVIFQTSMRRGLATYVMVENNLYPDGDCRITKCIHLLLMRVRRKVKPHGIEIGMYGVVVGRCPKRARTPARELMA